MSNERDAMRAMLEWIDSNAELMLQALDLAARTTEKSLAELKAVLPHPATEPMMLQSIETWRKLHGQLSTLYENLPAREVF
jgi:hypothetical protein